MTNALGIAAVTAVLIDQLNNAVIDASGVNDVRVSARPPEALRAGGAEPSNRLNIFLYRVERNQGWLNECLPERSSRGDRVGKSLLPLDLHYLLSAYGNSDIEAEILLGYGMQVIQELPVLDRDAIRRSLGAGAVTGGDLPAPFRTLAAADLADQVEQVKVTHHQLGVEEEWRLWAALNTGLRPSATYKASTVLIEPAASVRSPLPVRQARFQVDQIRRPVIERIQSAAALDGTPSDQVVIRRGHFLTITGSGLRGIETIVRLGGADVTPAAAQVSDQQVVIGIPTTIQPGLLGVQIVHRIPRPLPVGTPRVDPAPQGSTTPMIGELSNAMIAPVSVGIPAGGIAITNLVVDSGRANADVGVTFDHPVGSDQRISLRLNEFDPPADRDAHAFTIDAQPSAGPGQVASADFAVRGVPAAHYLVRVSIDGVDSELFFSGGRYADPQIDLGGP